MLNLVNLTIISMLSIGMAANVMPFGHTESTNEITYKQPRNQNIVNNYSFELQQSGQGTDQTHYEYIQENVWGNDREQVIPYAYTSAYLNIIATQYSTTTYKELNGSNKIYVINYEKYENNMDTLYENSTRMMYVLQITPYNYNIDTETSIKLTLNIGTWQDSNGDWIEYQDSYFNKKVYQTTQEDWSIYLNRQNVAYGASQIEEDIKDIDNGFYYTENTDVIDMNRQNEKWDDTTINITPQQTNYIILEYIPMAKARYYDAMTQEWSSFGTLVSTIPFRNTNYTYTPLTISGTNIIPDGTYEVIDLPGLMWEVVTMPFAFVSQAFNLTLFPGTPYQVNISNLFLSIIAVFVFVWLLQFFLKMKG